MEEEEKKAYYKGKIINILDEIADSKMLEYIYFFIKGKFKVG